MIMSNPSRDFEPFVERAKGRAEYAYAYGGRHSTSTSTGGRTGQDGVSSSRQVSSMSTFIRSALTEKVAVRGQSSEGGVAASMSREDSASVKRGKGRVSHRDGRGRKKMKIGIGEWERMVGVVKWCGGERLEESASPETDISSYSDDSDSSIASCHSPEIGTRSMTVEEEIVMSVEESIDSSCSSDAEHSPHTEYATPTKTQIIRGIPISMAMMYASVDEDESIESPPSSPELSHMTRIKATDWIKNVSVELHEDDDLNETMKTPDDSSKRGRKKRFVSGGLAEQLQCIIQRENSDITFWEHRSMNQEIEQEDDSRRCLLLRVFSLVNCCSMILAEARVHQSYHPPEDSAHYNGLSQGQLVTVIFSLRTVKHLSLKVGHLIKIHPPWQCLAITTSSQYVILCTHFCQVISHTPLSSGEGSPPKSPIPCKPFGVTRLNQFLSPVKFACSAASLPSMSPVKGLFPTRLFSREQDTVEGKARTVEELAAGRSGACCGVMQAVGHAKRGFIKEMSGVVRKVFRRKGIGSQAKGEPLLSSDKEKEVMRWCLVIEDEAGLFVEVECPLHLSTSDSWIHLVREGKGKTVNLTNLRMVEKASFTRCPELLSLVTSLWLQRHAMSTPNKMAPPTTCYRMSCDEDSEACLLEASSSGEKEEEEGPQYSSQASSSGEKEEEEEEGPCSSSHCSLSHLMASGLKEGRVSLLARVVYFHSEVSELAGNEVVAALPKSGHYLFVMTLVHSGGDSPSLPISVEYSKIYLKPNFSLAGLKPLLSCTGTKVLLEDILYKTTEGMKIPLLSMDACSLIVPINKDWSSNDLVREYPLYSPAHKEEMDLQRIQMPIFPSLDHTHSLPDTIVSLDGYIVGVDEKNAFSWPVCDSCNSDRLVEDEPNTSALYCEGCGRVTTSPAVHIDLCVFIQCPGFENYSEISLKLRQSTIGKLLPVSPSSVDQGFEVDCLINKRITLPSCYVLGSRETSLAGDSSVLMLEELSLSFST